MRDRLRQARRSGPWVPSGLIGFMFALGLSCAQIPTAPPRRIDFDFQLVGRDGTVAPDAWIYLRPTRYSYYRQSDYGRTDSTGHAHFQIGEGHYVGEIEGDGPFPSRVQIPDFTVSERSPAFTFRLSGFYLSGQVYGPGDVPLDVGTISLSGRATDGAHQYEHFSFHDGAFRALVPAGVYSIYASSGSYPSPYPIASHKDVAVGNDTTLIFHLDGYRIDGHVAGRAGVPIGGAHVQAISTENTVTGTTDAAGAYFVYIPAGSYRWWIHPPDSMSYVMDRTVSQSTIAGPGTRDFSLDGALWTGTVNYAGSGAPVAGVRVTAYPWLMSSRGAYDVTGLDGSFHLVVEPGLEYDLRVQDTSYYGETLGIFRTAAAGNDSTFTLTIDASAAATPVPRAARAGAE